MSPDEAGPGAGEEEADAPDAGGRPPGREPGGDQGTGECELCGGPTYERHCKIVCLNCGYVRDCSDP